MSKRSPGRPETSSNAYKRYYKQSEFINEMITDHIARQSKKPGCKKSFDQISRASIVLMCAAWQAYIEDLVKEIFFLIINNTDSFRSLDEDMQKRCFLVLSAYYANLGSSKGRFDWKIVEPNEKKECRSGTDGLFLQSYNGDWKNSFLSLLDRSSIRINTPNSSNVSEIYKKWLGLTKEDALLHSERCFKLDEIDNILIERHKIAHGADTRNTSESATSQQAESMLYKINIIVDGIDRYIPEFLKKCYDLDIWVPTDKMINLLNKPRQSV